MSARNDSGSGADIAHEAATWFARLRDGTHGAREQSEFEAWRARSAAHAQAYERTERDWAAWGGQLQGSQRMRDLAAAALADFPEPEGSAREGQSEVSRERSSVHRREVRSAPVSARRPWVPLLLAASLAAVAVVGALVLPRFGTPPVAYATQLGEQRTETLADGTVVTLNTATALEVRYGRGRREIALQRGEALFDVAHDADRPFVVAAGDGTVTALGTRFLVRAVGDVVVGAGGAGAGDGTGGVGGAGGDAGAGDAIAVTLLQGRVEVVARNMRAELAPGQQARYGDADGLRVRNVDPAAVAAWTRGRLDFSGLPLGQAVAEANRYSTVKLRLGDPAMADLPVGGSFRTGDNGAIADALSAVFPVRVAERGKSEIVLMPR